VPRRAIANSTEPAQSEGHGNLLLKKMPGGERPVADVAEAQETGIGRQNVLPRRQLMLTSANKGSRKREERKRERGVARDIRRLGSFPFMAR